MTATDKIMKVLDLARWAPSGDNTQPWRFEIVDGHHGIVHGFDTRAHCVYDLDGRNSQLALGGLIETAAIAASTVGLSMRAQRRTEAPEDRPTFDLSFEPSPQGKSDPLAAFIRTRTVQRSPLQTRPLRAEEKNVLLSSVGPGYSLQWMEGADERRRAVRLMSRTTKLRLALPEAYSVERDTIDWGTQFSESRIPDQSLGMDAFTSRAVRFAMQSWQRFDFFNRYLGGSIAARVQCALIPSLACAGHFALFSRAPVSSVDDYIAAGRAMQRLWLTITALDLQMQPEMTPLIFARYARQGLSFSSLPGAQQMAERVRDALQGLIGEAAEGAVVFMGRVGAGRPPSSRSVRKPLAELTHPSSQ